MAEREYIESNNTFGKRAFFMILLMLSVVIAYTLAPVFEKEKAAEAGPGEGLVTYNASRYFFRFDYPKEWITEYGQNGFLLDKESGLVVNLVPAVKVPVAGNDDDGVVTRYENIKLSFFYNVPSDIGSKYAKDKDGNYPEVPVRDLMDYYTKRLRNGLVPEVGIVTKISYDYVEFEVEDEKTELYAADFTATKDGSSLYGTLYCARRAKAVYAIVLTYKSPYEFMTFSERVLGILSSFRLTVLAD